MEQVKQYVVADGLIDLGVKGGTFVRLEDYAALQQKLDAVLAENVVLKCGAEYFMYSPDCGFERYRSHAEAINAANEMIDDYRADAHDGWCDEVEGVCVGVILKYAQQCEEQKPSEENGFLGSVNYVMPEEQTPATEAILNEVRAEGLAMFAAQRADLSKTYAQNQDSKMAIQNDWVASKAQLFADQLRANKIKVGD